jgi:hypothetical protein
MLLSLLLFLNNTKAQEFDIAKFIFRKNLTFEPVPGVFCPKIFENINDRYGARKVAYGFEFANKSFNIKYYLPQQSTLNDSSCGYFVVFNQKIKMINSFEEDFACDLDVNSLKVYQFEFKGKNYLVITGIIQGSGNRTSDIVCNLFDITDRTNILYYPLWSKFGGISCFSDFNKDGYLDFLKVRTFRKYDTLKITMMSLKNGRFESYQDNNHFIILKLSEKYKVKVLKKIWFNN